MSTESITDLNFDSLNLASVSNPKSTQIIESDEDIIDCTEKYVELCRNLKTMEETVSAKSEMKRDLGKYEEVLDAYFYEITKNSKLDDVVIIAECYISMYFIKLPTGSFELEQLHVARFFVTQCMTLLWGKELQSKAILTAITVYNALSSICVKLNSKEFALKHLNKAFYLYTAYTRCGGNFPPPISILVSLGIKAPTNTVYLLDKVYMNTLKSLIMLKYNDKSVAVDMEKITTYMHQLLRKQLEDIPETVDHVSWTREAVRLAEYFSSCDRFVECKNHLGLASVIITRFYNERYKTNAKLSAEEKRSLYCQYKYSISVIDACWARYGLALLFSSYKRLLNQKDEKKTSGSTQSVKQPTKPLLKLPCADQQYEEFIYMTEDNYITHYDEAKVIFVNILQLLNKIRSDTFLSENTEARIEITQYISKAYKYLAFFVHDKVNQIKLHKRRVDILEDCLTTLSEENITLRSIIWFELVLINTTILNLRNENTSKEVKSSVKLLEETNQLVEKSKVYLQLYSDNRKFFEDALRDGLVDGSYQLISKLNIKYSF